MSLFDNGDREGFTSGNYAQQAAIPEEERCVSCEGYGIVRWRCSWTGPDYRVCFFCHGNGRKERNGETNSGT